MKIALLCRNPNLYSHRRLIKAAESRGHEIRAIDPLACSMNITANRPAIRYRDGEVLKDFDAVIPRIGASITFYGTAVLRQFEVMGVLSLNDSLAIARARDKLRALQLLSRSQVPMPTTVFARNPDDTDDVIRLVGGAPLVVKLLEGTQGIGVVLAETKKAAESVIQAFEGLDVNILVQEFIKEARGNDIRCLVIGNKVVAAMERHANEGEFRANLHRGGGATLARITPGRTQAGGPRGQDSRSQRRRRRSSARRARLAGAGSQFLSRARRNRARLQQGYRRHDHRIFGKEMHGGPQEWPRLKPGNPRSGSEMSRFPPASA